MSFTASQLHVNQALTDLATRYSPDEAGYLWNKLLPMKVEQKRSNFIRAINTANLLRKYDLRVGRGGSVPEIQFKLDPNLMFNCQDYAVQALLSNTENAEADEVLMYDQESIYHVWIAMQVGMEGVVIHDTLRNPAVLTNNVTLTASQLWDNPNSQASRPLSGDLIPACARVKVLTGHKANMVVMHEYVWRKLQVHPEVLARGGVHPVGNAIVDEAQMERILGVEPGALHITSQFVNVGLEDQAEDFRSFIGADVIVAYVEPAQTRTVGLGLNFMFQSTKLSNGTYAGNVEEVEAPFLVLELPEYNRDPRTGTIHRIVGGVDPKVLNARAGFLIKGVVDSTNTALYQSLLTDYT